MARVAVILSGCGYLDGAEVREAVIALLELDRAGAEVECFAPDIEQFHVVNHLSGEESGGDIRNVLVEAARIARGKVKDLAGLDASAFDALILPGGFGVAKNLSDLAFKGASASVNEDFKSVIKAFISAGKPIGAICIAPAVLVAAVDDKKVTVTIGDDSDGLIESMGGCHSPCSTDEYIYDKDNNIVSCSAYMREDSISKVALGISGVVKKVLANI